MLFRLFCRSFYRNMSGRLGVLCPLGLAVLLIAISLSLPASAVPNCSQINTTWCSGGDLCLKVIEWQGTCGVDRQWRCHWYGSPYCQEYIDPWSYCNCDGPGCDCLLEGTPITLADGTIRPIELLKAGDRVLGFDEANATFKSTDVLQVHTPYTVDHYFVINGAIRITEFHPVLRRGKWIAVGDLKIGDPLIAADGSETWVSSLKRIDVAALVYNIQVGTGTYIAHGVIVHNKEDCLKYEVRYPY